MCSHENQTENNDELCETRHKGYNSPKSQANDCSYSKVSAHENHIDLLDDDFLPANSWGLVWASTLSFCNVTGTIHNAWSHIKWSHRKQTFIHSDDTFILNEEHHKQFIMLTIINYNSAWRKSRCQMQERIYILLL